MKTTICAKCKHVMVKKLNSITWFDWFCTHHSVTFKKVLNVVTGITGYESGEFPNCRDINTGKCGMWSAK